MVTWGQTVSSFRLLGVLSLLMACGAGAGVTIQGHVFHWDEIAGTAGTFKPVRHAIVHVERDWHGDVSTTTDDNGFYSVTVGNPLWGTVDGVDIEVYAEVDGRSHVWSTSVPLIAPWPYHAISQEFDDIPSNSTFTLDMRFGKPANVATGLPNLHVGSMNLAESLSNRSIEDVAKAFIVHHEMLDHRTSLAKRGWPPSGFGDIDCIVPALAPLGWVGIEASYYNHFSDNINLVIPGNWTGLGAWVIEKWHPGDNTGRALLQYPNFLYTVRHEYSHGIHDASTVVAPAGLNMPSDHNPWSESNRWVAYTEGFADFLVLSTLGLPPSKHLWDHSNSFPGGVQGLKLPAGDHWAMEGEVTGLLLDLFDPPAYEVVRHPAKTTADGLHPVPAALQEKQVWWDNVWDSDLSHIRTVVSQWSPLLYGSVQTVRQFTDLFVVLHPQLKRDLKVIAFNRDITSDNLPEEHPATLIGNTTVKRQGANVTLECTVREPDADDRPWVRLSAYQQLSNGQFTAAPGILNWKLSSGWAGDVQKRTIPISLDPGWKPGDALWLEVNDDMLPQVYRFTVPEKDDTVVDVATPKPPPPPEGLSHPPDLRQKPPWQKPGPPPKQGLRERFETPLAPTWRIGGAARVAEDRGNHLLASSGLSTGVLRSGPLDAFTLTLRYRHAQGVADILFRSAVPQEAAGLYHLTIGGNALALARETAEGLRTEAVAPLSLVPGTWYDLVVRRTGGQLAVSVGGAEGAKLAIPDPKPLATDQVAFGSLAGSGFGFDDIGLTHDGEADAPAEPGKPLPGIAAEYGEKNPLPPEVLAQMKKDREDVERLRLAIREAKAELRAFADRKKLEFRQEEAFYRLAHKRDGLAVQAKAPELFRRPRDPRAAPEAGLAPAQAADLKSFQTWLGQRAKGQALAQPFAAGEKAVLRARLTDVDAAIQKHGQAVQRAPELRRKLADAFAAIRSDPQREPMRKAAERDIKAIQAALQTIEGDKELVPALEEQRRALDTISR